jgi:vitamin K-dependent gamma-carboxylase-like protein
MIFVPAHRSFSLDARRRPEIRSETVPAWTLWILRFQMGIVYFFGGVAKINRDWFNGEPLRGWMAARTDFPIIGALFTQPWLVYGFAYGSLLLDLFAFPLLLIKRTRPYIFAALLLFHLMNSRLFDIGIFPWLAIAATTLFFDPGWPRALLGRRRPEPRTSKRSRKRIQAQEEKEPIALGRAHRVTVGLLAFYVAVQVLVPLRHFVYAGDVSWTEEGQRFSWQMMLRQKKMLARFFVTPPDTGESFEVDPSEYLTSFQYGPMGIHPYLILEFAHHLGSEYASEDGQPAEVNAHVVATLNGRRAQLLVDPRVDLARIALGPGPRTWIVPLGDDLWIPPPGSDATDVVRYVEEFYGEEAEDRPPVGPVPPA